MRKTMFPTGDESSRKTVLLFTYAVIAWNVVFYIIGLTGGEAAIMKWVFIPNRFLTISLDNYLTILMSIICMPGGYSWKSICSVPLELPGKREGSF